DLTIIFRRILLCEFQQRHRILKGNAVLLHGIDELRVVELPLPSELLVRIFLRDNRENFPGPWIFLRPVISDTSAEVIIDGEVRLHLQQFFMQHFFLLVLLTAIEECDSFLQEFNFIVNYCISLNTFEIALEYY